MAETTVLLNNSDRSFHIQNAKGETEIVTPKATVEVVKDNGARLASLYPDELVEFEDKKAKKAEKTDDGKTVAGFTVPAAK